jgi:hypothetical protein
MALATYPEPIAYEQHTPPSATDLLRPHRFRRIRKIPITADHTRAAWECSNPSIGLRIQVDFLLENHMLLRFSNRRALELCDCFSLNLQNKGLHNGETKLPMRILVIIVNRSKTNQYGNKEYGATMRHRDPFCCLIGQFVMDGAIPIEVSVLCVLRREENSRYRLLLVV